MSKKVKLGIRHVEPHQGGQRYRRRIPPDVRSHFGDKRSWFQTFPARTPLGEVERQAKALAVKHDAEIARARGKGLSPQEIFNAEFDANIWLETSTKAEIFEMLGRYLASKPEGLTAEERAFVSAIQNDGKAQLDGMILSVALAEDTEKHGQGRNPRPILYAVNSFIGTVDDKRITEITRSDVTSWIKAQHRLSPATILRALGVLRALINRCYRDLELDRKNPFAEHKINGGGGAASRRLPFNKAMLDRIDTYIAGSKRQNHETVNIIRIMKRTGGGPAEIGGLAVADVILDGEIPYIWIRANANRGLKTGDVRDRKVPLIGEALVAAQDALKHAQARSGTKNPHKTPLFTAFGSFDRGADAISGRLNRAIRAAGIPKSPRLTAYSYRHTIKAALRYAEIPMDLQDGIMGHSGESRISAGYGSPQALLSKTRNALERALKHLGDVDSSIYGEDEWME